jgi:hypothetical protein
MKIKYLSVKDEVKKQTISIQHISTSLMIANPLTKGLPPKQFGELVTKMGVVSRDNMYVI